MRSRVPTRDEDGARPGEHLPDGPAGPMYRQLAPPAGLESLVEGIWVQQDLRKANTAAPPTLVLPTGTPEIIFYYGDPFVRLSATGPVEEPGLAFGGQRTRAIRVAATGRTGVVIVRFHPWGAGPFLGVPTGALRDRLVPLREVVPGSATAVLEERLRETAGWEDSVALIRNYLLAAVRWGRHSRLVQQAAVEVRRRGGAEPVQLLSERLGVSRRHLCRTFQSTLGLSPKRFACVVRFQRSLHMRGRGMAWAANAEASGYVDQAHLIHEWREITGQPPQSLLARHPPTVLAVRFNGAPSHFYNTTYL